MTTWHKYPDIKPSPSAKYSDFLVAYPNPRLFTSKFANVRFNDGRPRYVYDVSNWTGTQFAMTDSKVRYWSPIPSPDNISALSSSSFRRSAPTGADTSGKRSEQAIDRLSRSIHKTDCASNANTRKE